MRKLNYMSTIIFMFTIFRLLRPRIHLRHDDLLRLRYVHRRLRHDLRGTRQVRSVLD